MEGSVRPLCGRASLPLLLEAPRSGPRFKERGHELKPRDERRATITVWKECGETDAEDQLLGKMQPAVGASGEWVKVNTYQ